MSTSTKRVRPTLEEEFGPSPRVTDREAAHLVGVSVETFRRWVSDGYAPAGQKLGPGKFGTVRWSRSEIEGWIADRPRAGSAV